jgi:hypothetical protein
LLFSEYEQLYLRQAGSTRVKFLAEIFDMRKHLLTLSLAKLRQKAEAIKMYKMFVYGNKLHIVNSFCTNVLKIATT